MFACTLFMPMRTNSTCLHVRYSCECGRIARAVFACTLFVRIRTNRPSFVYATLADADEKPEFACTLFGRMRTKLIARVCMYAIRVDADE